MGCFLAVVGLIFPRILIIVLWFFTSWFEGVYSGILIPILGFIFLPFTMLWYSVVVNYFNGEWGIISVLGMVIAIAADIGALGSGERHRRSRI